MTTIVWDGRSLAADRRGTNGFQSFRITKIRRCSDGRLIGGAGAFGAVSAYLDWLESGVESERPAFQLNDDDCVHALEIMPDGRVYRHEQFSRFEVVAPAAIGTGASVALAALKCGQQAKRAVAVAIDVEIGGVGFGVDVLRLDKRNHPNLSND